MISVCMATYNGGKFIQQQVSSILRQLGKDGELIISDDGSTDNTLEIIRAFNDPRIVLLHHAQPDCVKQKKICRSCYLAANNFEYALSHAQGDIIFLADQDDIFSQDKFSKMGRILENYDYVLSNCSIIDEENNVIQRHRNNRSRQPLPKSVVFNVFCHPGMGCCMGFRKTLLNIALPFPKNLIAHDTWLHAIATRKFTSFFINEDLTLYRRHGDNVTTTFGRSSNPYWFRIYYRVVLLFQVLRRLCFYRP